MASLIKQSGRYYLQFYDSNQKPTRKKVSLKTSRKRSAKSKQRELEDAFVEGRYDPWNDDPFHYSEPEVQRVPLTDAFKRFEDRKREENRSEHTIRTYREIVSLLMDEVGSTKIDDLESDSLRQFIRKDSLAKATQYKRFGHLRTFFRWCVNENLAQSNPLQDITAPDKPSKLPKAITEEELDELCDTIQKDYNRKRRKNWVREGQLVWRIPIFRFAFYTGMRGSELARLRWKHIDFENGLIYIRKQKNRKEQTIPLNRKAREVLEELENGDANDYVFQSPSFDGKNRNPKWFRENVSDAFRKARKDAGLRDELSFHSLRHGFCTALAEAGKSAVVIKEAARHADISTSMRYVHMANEQLKREIEDSF